MVKSWKTPHPIMRPSLGSLMILILIGYEILIFSKLENIFFIIFKITERL